MQTFKHLFIIPMLIILTVWMSYCSKNSTNPKKTVPDKTSILVLSNYAQANEWIDTTFTKYVDGLEFTSFELDPDTPSVEFLSEFDLVFLFEDGVFETSHVVGDSLYEYVMNGGDLLLSTFYWQDRSDGGWNHNWGQLETIDPILGGSCDYRYDSLGVVLSHPLIEGVDSLYTYYRGGVDSLRANATAVAWWADGDILIAYNRPGGTITAVTTYPAEPFVEGEETYEDFIQLWTNAIYWTAWGTTVTKPALNLAKPAVSSTKVKEKILPSHHTSGTGNNIR